MPVTETTFTLPNRQEERALTDGTKIWEVVTLSNPDGTLVDFYRTRFTKIAFDENNSIKYYGYMDKNGAYFIEKWTFNVDGSGTIEFFNQDALTFAVNWVGRAGLAYVQAPIY